jgi:predicted RNA-binding Zn-ribbon protein involved in translation (DUF1610 family)
MKEISPKELQKINEKSFKNTQKVFRRRLREIAAGGDIHAEYKPKDYKYGEQIKPWLESLGFKVKEIGPSWYQITWPEEEDVFKRLRSEQFNILAQPMSAKVHYALAWVNAKYGTWTRDVIAHDYECSKCGNHAKYVSDYCPNCGERMKVKEGESKYV